MRKIRLLSIILTLCICLSLAIPAAYAAESTSYLEVSYAQASSLEVGQPITITGVANYNAHTSNDSTTLLAIDAPDGTWFAAIGSFSSDAFKATIGSCDVTLYGVYAGTMDINGMPIIDVQQGTLSYTGCRAFPLLPCILLLSLLEALPNFSLPLKKLLIKLRQRLPPKQKQKKKPKQQLKPLQHPNGRRLEKWFGFRPMADIVTTQTPIAAV